MSAGLVAACRRLPTQARQIEKLFKQDESFESLCEDLGAAELALSKLDQLPESLRDARRSECESWIDSLTEEIENALRRAKIVPLTRPPGH